MLMILGSHGSACWHQLVCYDGVKFSLSLIFIDGMCQICMYLLYDHLVD